ncbi:MAG: DUF4062 domain-containing protein [Dorea sp.]|nr:DUF4062 domain-containing protein [Dorea sp.]
MESTKYQVFISSTYSDLLKERRRVLDILLMADCIPAGMENFVATDDEQFSVIKKVIDLCDYYILILGKRYGSVNEATGISYTEMEYNYAIDKGIPVLVFVLDDSVEVDDDKIEKDDIKKGKLAAFKSRAMRNRLASVWKDQSDLMGKVAIAIMQAKNEIKRPGWHRGNDEEKDRMLKQIEFLQAENEDLRKQISSFGVVKKDIDFEEAFYGKEIVLHFTEKVFVFTSNTVIDKKTIKTTLDNLFKFVSLRITGIKKISEFKDAISSFQGGYYVNEQDALVVRNKFEQLNLIESFVGKDDVEMIKLTDFGKGIMNELNE